MAKHVHTTWYLLADGTQADPNDVSPGADGVLRHKNGMPVAMREGGVPMTVGVDAARESMNEAAAKAGEKAIAEAGKIVSEDQVDAANDEPGALQTDIDPATGAPRDPDGSLPNDAQPVDKPKAKEAKAADRELKAGKSKRYKTR